MIELLAKNKVCEGGREMEVIGNGMVKFIINIEIGESARER
jgi:hypothetical protein